MEKVRTPQNQGFAFPSAFVLAVKAHCLTLNLLSRAVSLT